MRRVDNGRGDSCSADKMIVLSVLWRLTLRVYWRIHFRRERRYPGGISEARIPAFPVTKLAEDMNTQATTFWETLPRPIIGLSPMDGITDHPYRHIQKKHGNPMLLFTEFTPFDGICAGASALLKDFLYDESQRPIIGQIYGRKPNNFYQTAIVLCELGFDGIDINMGCPSKSVAHAGSGAGLIRTPRLAQEIVRATQQGVYDWQNGATVHDCVDIPVKLVAQVEARHERLPAAFRARRPIPVSVKTRIGYEAPQVDEWIPQLLESAPVAITLHGRTLTQGYTGEADWSEIGHAAEIARGSGILILGNGDVKSLDDAYQRIATYGLDGALIGRASYGNPYIFRPQSRAAQHDATLSDTTSDTISDTTSDTISDTISDTATSQDKYEILHLARAHAQLYAESFAHLDRYQFLPMRKHLGWYVRQLPGASHLRRALTQASSVDEAVAVIDEYLAYREQWEHSQVG
jgi:tRNA-dihydrouridine synthase B